MTRIAILGDGVEAAQIGCEYALGGCTVIWIGVDRERSQHRVEEALRAASAHGLAGPVDLERARALIAHRTPGEVADGRLTLIVETLPEPLEQKAAALAQLAAAHPEALVASTGESISVTALGTAAGVGERIVATRYGEPPMLIPVVELLAARDTPPRLLDRVSQLLRAIGKRPVTLRREVPGMLAGRLELALLRECLWLLERGVAGAEEIDEVVRDGLARPWRTLGPLQAAQLRDLASLEALGAAVEATPSRSGLEALAAIPPKDHRLLGGLRERRDQALAEALRAERARAERLASRPE
jgi:L-gulonate 3-dehydrogenase